MLRIRRFSMVFAVAVVVTLSLHGAETRTEVPPAPQAEVVQPIVRRPPDHVSTPFFQPLGALTLPRAAVPVTTNGGRPDAVQTDANPLASAISLGGHANRAISVDRNPTANSPGNALIVAGGAASTASGNLAGGDLLLAGGISSGSAFSGDVRVLASLPRVNGSGDNLAYIDRVIIGATPKNMTGTPGSYSAAIFSVLPSYNYPAAGKLHVTVVASDGAANAWTTTGTYAFIASGSGGTCQLAGSLLTVHGSIGVTCGVAPQIDGSFAFSIRDTFNVPVTLSAHYVYYWIENTSGQAVNLLP